VAIGVHVGTWHFDRDAGYRETNPGIYVRADEWQAGYYRNSLDRNTLYVTRAFRVPHTERVEVNVGLATGYRDGARPTVLTLVSYRFDNGLRAGLIPLPAKLGGGIHIAHEFK
jgi:hypothetical protein